MSDEILGAQVQEKQWFALRDLKRSNAVLPAFKQLSQLGIEVFTPTQWRIVTRHGRKERREIAVMHDLLFAYDTRKNLDPIIARISTLQYRYKKGGAYCEPIVVPEEDMNRFMGVVRASAAPKYYSADELSSLMCGKTIRIVGGPMNGQEGKLQSIRGSKVKRMVVMLPNLLAVSVEIENEYIQVVE